MNEDISLVVELLKKIKSDNGLRSYILITNDGFTVNISRSGNYYDILQSLVAAFNDKDNLLMPIATEAIKTIKKGGEE